MKSKEFIDKLLNIAKNYKTVYMWGVFGSPVSEQLILGKFRQYPSWYTTRKRESLRSLIGKHYFAFDCVNLIKAILWGWTGSPALPNGGSVYCSNNVPDVSANGMLAHLTDVSSNFSNIIPGEAVWMEGHIGVYIGDGRVVECTPSWANGVQITACLNIGLVSGLKGRYWIKHGKIPYIEYEKSTVDVKKLPILKMGSTGEDVKIIQGIVGVAKDGEFGPKTLDAVMKWQVSRGLTADGVVGPVTWSKILKI